MDLKLSAILMVFGISFFVGGLMYLVGYGWLYGLAYQEYIGAKTKKEKSYTYIAIGVGIGLFLLGMILASYKY